MPNEPKPTPLSYASKRSRSGTPMDAMETALWTIWALLLFFFAITAVLSNL